MYRSRPGAAPIYAPDIAIDHGGVIVRRYLVVANQTLVGEQLLACVRARMQAGPSHFHVLVPATPASQLDEEYVAGVPEHLRIAASTEPGDEHRLAARELLEDEVDEIHADRPGEHLGRVVAREQLREALARLRTLGADAGGEVGVPDPLEAIGIVLRRHEFDEIILSTLPGRSSRWLTTDLPSRVRRRYKLPVTQVTGPAHVVPQTSKE
jgi:GABA permease